MAEVRKIWFSIHQRTVCHLYPESTEGIQSHWWAQGREVWKRRCRTLIPRDRLGAGSERRGQRFLTAEGG